MQKKLKHFLLAILFPLWGLGGFGLGGFAQTYPVTIYSQFTYPTPIYLSNYANRTTVNSPLKVQLVLNDLTIMNRQIRLKLYFSGTSGYFMSKDYVIGAQPLYLQGGFPLQLTNLELGPYFEFQNLQGINPNQYGQPLGEGTYDFCVEVYDFATNKKLSKKTCVSTVIFQNDPPILNLPVNQAKVMRQDIQNIIFNWTPRNTNVSNVEYEFSLVELWNPNIPYQTAFDYAPPLYTESTRMTSLQYDVMKPQLIPGKSYAWRVKAKALKGAEEIGMFKNNGFSEVFTFKYLSQCNAPMNVTTEGVSQDQAKIKWTGITTNSFDYQVNYREKNARSKWYTITTPREYTTITNLKPNTAYEYTVGTACDKGEYTLSSINEFTTLDKDEIAFAGCNLKPDLADLANKTPLPALYPNDVVTAGDFPIVVQHVSGGNGTFSGDGFVTLPFINKFKEKIGGTIDANSDQNVGIRITFNNIGVNTDFKLISGEIVASYDSNWNSMIDADKLVEDIKNLVSSIKESFDKLDKLEEKKKTGAISNEEYIKNKDAIWNDIQKGNDQYKELIKATDLPDELKEKVAALTPPLPELVSNDNTAVKGNPESQKKEYLEKIDKITKEVEENNLALDGQLTPPINVTETSGQTLKVPKITVALLNDIRLHCTVNDGLSVKIGMTKAQTKTGEFYSFCKAENGTFYYYQGDEYWYIQGKWYVETLCGQEYCLKVCTKNNNDGTGVYERIEMEQGESTIVQTLNFVNKTCLIDIPLLIVGGASTKIPVVVFNTISTITIEVLNRSEVLSDREALVSQVAAILVTHQLSSETPAATRKLAEKVIEKIKNGWKLSGKSKEELVVEVEKTLGKAEKNVQNVFKAGDKISDITIDRIKNGSNGKIAIIGRTMGNSEIKGVKNVYRELISKGYKNVEIFDENVLTGVWNTKFKEALNEMKKMIEANNGKWLDNNQILKTKMYELNKEWAQKLVNEGYEVIDMGDIILKENDFYKGFSPFYTMEKSVIFK